MSLANLPDPRTHFYGESFCSRPSRLMLNACRRLNHSIVLNCIKAYRKHIVSEGFLHKFELVIRVYHACKHVVKLHLFPLSIHRASVSTGVHEFLLNTTWTPLHIRFHNVDTTLLSPLWWWWHTVVIKEVVRHRCLFHNVEVSAAKVQLVNRQCFMCMKFIPALLVLCTWLLTTLSSLPEVSDNNRSTTWKRRDLVLPSSSWRLLRDWDPVLPYSSWIRFFSTKWFESRTMSVCVCVEGLPFVNLLCWVWERHRGRRQTHQVMQKKGVWQRHRLGMQGIMSLRICRCLSFWCDLPQFRSTVRTSSGDGGTSPWHEGRREAG